MSLFVTGKQTKTFDELSKQIDVTNILCKGYKTNNDFAKFKTTQSFGDAIRNRIIV